jgi:hypothetical protein
MLLFAPNSCTAACGKRNKSPAMHGVLLSCHFHAPGPHPVVLLHELVEAARQQRQEVAKRKHAAQALQLDLQQQQQQQLL